MRKIFLFLMSFLASIALYATTYNVTTSGSKLPQLDNVQFKDGDILNITFSGYINLDDNDEIPSDVYLVVYFGGQYAMYKFENASLITHREGRKIEGIVSLQHFTDAGDPRGVGSIEYLYSWDSNFTYEFSLGYEDIFPVFSNGFFYSDENKTILGSIENTMKTMETIEIPNTVKTLESGVFRDCSITSVTIPESVEYMGKQCFSGCKSLKSVVIPEKVEKLYYGTFESCYNLESVEIKGNNLKAIENMVFADCQSLTLIEIPSSINYIGEDAFLWCDNLKYTVYDNAYYLGGKECPYIYLIRATNNNITSCVISEDCKIIASDAFSKCTSLTKITCYAVNPPEVYKESFSNYNGYLTIPCDNFEDYDIHSVWGTFKHVDCISAEETIVTKDAVVVEPEITEAVFSMPTTSTANSYSLTISNNNVTFCTLTFNAQGQLSNIDFSGNTLKAEIDGYQFTVTGLSAATDYGYSFKALSKSKAVLKEYTGKFTTKEENGTGGSSEGGEYSEGGSGQGGETAINNVELANAITIVNNQILVNGEAPEIVITVLGQKIANKNLKAGIYFVVIDGQNVKVSIQ